MSKTSEHNKTLLANVTSMAFGASMADADMVAALQATRGFKDRKPVSRAFTIGFVAARVPMPGTLTMADTLSQAATIIDGVSPTSKAGKVKGANVFIRTPDHERILAACRKAYSRLMTEAFPPTKAQAKAKETKAKETRQPRAGGVTTKKVKGKTEFVVPTFASRGEASKYFLDHATLLNLIADKNAGVTFKVGKDKRNVMASDVATAISQLYTVLIARDPAIDNEADGEA